jgi:DNA ligase-associated metallophosphoesterase
VTDAVLTLCGEVLALLPERVLHLPDHRTLLVADAHFGKAASFRALGVPVPRGTTAETLSRLEAAVARTGAHTLVFLGDLLHSRHGRTPAALAELSAWRTSRSDLRLVLVRGNHDRHAGDPPAGLGFEIVDDGWRLGPFACRHAPESGDAGYVLCGHLHPAVILRGAADGRLRLPCFHFGTVVGVLPAFGAFTGSAVVVPAAGDRVFAVAEDRVLEVPVALSRGRRRAAR